MKLANVKTSSIARTVHVVAIVLVSHSVRMAAAENPAAIATPAEDGDSAVLRFEFVPELKTLAPFQPLYVKLAIVNPTVRKQGVPTQVRAEGIRFDVREVGYQAKQFDRSNELFRIHDTIRPNSAVADFYALAVDHLPADRRRSPKRIFDLDGDYELQALSGSVNDVRRSELVSDLVSIKVRKPSDDEELAGQILKGVAIGPPYSWSAGSDKEVEQEIAVLRQFLTDYPASVFADDFKLLLGKRILQVSSRHTETEHFDKYDLKAEAIKHWMSVDAKRPWVRRTVMTKGLMELLCRPQLQEHLNVRAILLQWKAHPPHDKDDVQVQQLLKEWVPKIEESLRNNPQPEKVTRASSP